MNSTRQISKKKILPGLSRVLSTALLTIGYFGTSLAIAQAPAPDAGSTAGHASQAQPATVNTPKVRVKNGLLTIVAENSTLGQVLDAVKAATGTEIEAPTQGMSERVYINIGPASARDAISALLNGTSFDYVLLGSAQDPGGIHRLVLVSRGDSAPRQVETMARSQAPEPSGVSTQSVAGPDVDAANGGDPDSAGPTVASVSTTQIAADSDMQPPKEPLSPEQIQQMMRQKMQELRQQHPPQ